MHPQQPAFSSDLPTRGCYAGDLERGLMAASDPRSEAEISWKLAAKHRFLGGIFFWTGFDYQGEPGPLRWPAIGLHRADFRRRKRSPRQPRPGTCAGSRDDWGKL